VKRLVTTFASATLAATFGATISAAPLSLSQQPLFIATAAKPNVLLVLANSNSMDEDATGLAVGSAAPNSKSEIARSVAKNLVSNYTNTLNMGLMAFQQLTTGGDPVRLYQVHSSPYDVSFDPTNYDASYTGPRTGPTRRKRSRRNRPSCSSASRNISPAICTTTSVSNTTASCSRGPCRRDRRSIPRPSASPCTSRIIRSNTAPSKA